MKPHNPTSDAYENYKMSADSERRVSMKFIS